MASQHPELPRRSALTRLRKAAVQRVDARLAAMETEQQFRALVETRKHGYRAIAGERRIYDPLQAEPQWLPERISSRTVGIIGGSTIVVGLSAVIGALALALAGSYGLSAVVLVVAFLGVGANVVTCIWESKERERRKPEARRVLCLPESVGQAHADYVDTVARLRAVDASEAVVAGIEAQIGFAGELAYEAARLHAADASTSREGLAVRDTMIDLAANATALATMAEQHHHAVHATTVADPLLLARAPEEADFAPLSLVIAEESAAARKALAAATRST